MKFGISQKLALLIGFAALICIAISSLQLYGLKQSILDQRKELIRSQVESGVAIANDFLEQARDGSITDDEARRRALRALSAVRYGNNDYIFVHSYQGVMLANANAALIGKNFWDAKDPNGLLLFQALIKAAQQGGGYTPFLWARVPDEAPVPKLGYSAAVPEWQWEVGTGVYLDDLDELFWNKVYEASGGLLALLVVLCGCGFIVARSVTRPLDQITGVMGHLAAGDKSVEVPHKGRRDEVGAIAGAVESFKQAAIEQDRLEAEARDLRQHEEALRAEQAAAEHEKAEELRAFVADIEQGFEGLAAGDLTVRMTRPVAAEYEEIRGRFNGSVEKLETALGAVVGGITSIRSGLDEINTATGDLAQRTEQQAASLEETAAALSQVTRGINETAANAGQAQTAAEAARRGAEKGGAVVGRAVEAMAEIEKSSEEIGKIIGVIDEIAFQTNLLALNAGVEAARAGEAGKGFAVVAQEVRALAQRSAEAAKEIKDLISMSSEQVGRGVELVTASGKSLEEIVAEVAAMSTVVGQIAASAREQAGNLKEVSAAADQMDKVTQQNAAMVEETTAAAQSLANETDNLARLIAQFRTSAISGHAAQEARTARRGASPRAPSNRMLPAANASAKPMAPSAPRPKIQMKAAAVHAPAPAADEDDWKEF
ncbi:methyl-accepting chemotaxis protein [Consotaella aegiceratis]|uniref:methyl-accepting chemotaxis protein n=1 Tax=Consotaella aegiceratis TaxID=3097961 RepID=UPI002F3FB109